VPACALPQAAAQAKPDFQNRVEVVIVQRFEDLEPPFLEDVEA
jgi:hypothetical protein